MLIPRRRVFPAVVVGTVVGALGLSGGRAAAAEPTQQELLEQLKALQAKVEQLEARQEQGHASAPAAQDAREQKATVDALRSDTETRSQLLADEGFTAGYSADKGFVLQSADKRFLLHPWLQFMPRYTTTWRKQQKSNGDDDVQSGFEIRRMKLGFDGNVFSPDLSYLFNWATDRKSGNFVLEEAWGKYKFGGGPVGMRFGQIKDPVNHEQITSSKYLTQAERSYAVDLFLGGDAYIQAATLFLEDKKSPFRAEVAVTDGLRTNNTNFQDSPTNPADYGLAGRVEYKVFGEWKDYSQFSAQKDKQDLLVVGGGMDFTQGGRSSQTILNADVQWDTTWGLSVYGSYLGRSNHHNYGLPGTNGFPTSTTTATSPNANTYDYAALLQVGYVINNTIEPFGRYEYDHFGLDGLSSTITHRDISIISAGVNWYLHGHAAKVTLQAEYLPNGAPFSDDGAGILAGGSGKGEVVGIAQFQLLL